MQAFTAEVSNVRRQDNTDLLVGVLFTFGEVSKNNTLVREGAKVKVTSDVILRKHNYPAADVFHSNIAGRIYRFYEDAEKRALLCDFVVFDEAEKQKLLKNELAFSVGWLADNYKTENGVAYFDEVVIYETSLVDNPAFNTCAASDEDNLTCLKANIKNSACGCGGQNSACGCNKEKQDKSYISVMDQEIMQAIQLLQEELKALAERVASIEEKLSVSPETPTDAVEMEQAINSVQAQVLKHGELYARLEADFNRLMSAVSDFVDKASKQIRYA